MLFKRNKLRLVYLENNERKIKKIDLDDIDSIDVKDMKQKSMSILLGE
jgi:hypothetical protein